MKNNELDLQHFLEDMRGALGGEHKKTENLYTLKSGTFSWKRVLSSGMTAILGQMEVKSVPVVDSYEAILDKSLDNLVSLQKQVIELRDENSTLIKDRDSAIARVTEFAELKEEWEKKLYGRFTALLNAKKEKIEAMDLELMCLRNAASEDRGERGEGAGTSSKGKEGGWRRRDEDSDVDTEEEANEAAREDPYGADTDVDSDGSGAAVSQPGPSSRSTPATTAALRRNRAMFDSFDSSGSPSPAPVLPKRARMPRKAAASTAASTSGASGRNVFKDVVVQDQDEDDDDDMKPLTFDAADDDDEENLGENTQDLLDAI